MTVYEEERIWKVATMTYFKGLTQHLPTGTESNHNQNFGQDSLQTKTQTAVRCYLTQWEYKEKKKGRKKDIKTAVPPFLLFLILPISTAQEVEENKHVEFCFKSTLPLIDGSTVG
jgi:hypothetical protein